MDNHIKVYHGNGTAVGVLGKKVFLYSNGLHGNSPRWDCTYKSPEDARRLERTKAKSNEHLRTLVDRLTSIQSLRQGVA